MTEQEEARKCEASCHTASRFFRGVGEAVSYAHTCHAGVNEVRPCGTGYQTAAWLGGSERGGEAERTAAAMESKKWATPLTGASPSHKHAALKAWSVVNEPRCG